MWLQNPPELLLGDIYVNKFKLFNNEVIFIYTTLPNVTKGSGCAAQWMPPSGLESVTGPVILTSPIHFFPHYF